MYITSEKAVKRRTSEPRMNPGDGIVVQMTWRGKRGGNPVEQSLKVQIIQRKMNGF